MHLFPHSVFPRSSLSIAGLVLSVMCAWCHPTDAYTVQRLPTAQAVAPASEPVVDALVFDCNDNGIEDSVDIALGSSSDQNQNGVPDECEATGRGLVIR